MIQANYILPFYGTCAIRLFIFYFILWHSIVEEFRTLLKWNELHTMIKSSWIVSLTHNSNTMKNKVIRFLFVEDMLWKDANICWESWKSSFQFSEFKNIPKLCPKYKIFVAKVSFFGNSGHVETISPYHWPYLSCYHHPGSGYIPLNTCDSAKQRMDMLKKKIEWKNINIFDIVLIAM